MSTGTDWYRSSVLVVPKSSLQATGRPGLPARQTGENRRSPFFPARSSSRWACARPSAGTDPRRRHWAPNRTQSQGPLACAANPWTWARKAGSAAGRLIRWRSTHGSTETKTRRSVPRGPCGQSESGRTPSHWHSSVGLGLAAPSRALKTPSRSPKLSTDWNQALAASFSSACGSTVGVHVLRGGF